MHKTLTATKLEKCIKRVQSFKKGFDLLKDSVIITDSKARILYANKAVEKNNGFSQKEILGKNPGDLWGANMEKAFYKEMWHTIKNEKKPFVGEVKNKRKDGSFHWQELRISPILDTKKKIKFFIGIEPDITEKKQKRESQDDLLAVIGHHILTPVSGIRWTLDWLLSSSNLTDEQIRKLKEMYKENLGLTNLVEDLLLLALLEKGHPQRENIDLIPEIKNVLKTVRERHPHIQISLKIEVKKPITLYANKSLLNQVFANIITNAGEYSDPETGNSYYPPGRKKFNYFYLFR